MLVYRIAKTRYIRDLSETGAKRYGGRWNQKGNPVLYTSEHRSLAILEFLVHCSIQTFAKDVSIITLSLPDAQHGKALEEDQLPDNWRSYPAPFQLAEQGTNWLISGDSIFLKVPSVVVPEEWNILINPAHPDFQFVTIHSVSSFALDSRFMKNIQ